MTLYGTLQDVTPKIVQRKLIVATAQAWIGTPYHHQASVRGIGTDCLGLVRGIWRDIYGCEPEPPPPYTADWSEASGSEALLAAARRHLVETSPSAMQAGDVLLFRLRPGYPIKHVAVLVSDDRMIHAVEGGAVANVALAPWWRRRITNVFSYPHTR